MDSDDIAREIGNRVRAKALRDLWEDELKAAGWGGGPIPLITSPPERTWIWSDLHFSDRDTLEAFSRPFADTVTMNGHLIHEWHYRVRAGETIICLGDVAHPDAWRDRRLMNDIQGCPGERLLVLGNHDHDTQALRDGGFTTQCNLAVCATDPPLALSHAPLRRVPAGAINLHGHLHEGTEPTGRHINVALEQVRYSPAGLTWVLAEARRRSWAAEPKGGEKGTGGNR